MRHLGRSKPKVSYVLGGIVALLLAIGIACGSSATATAVPAATSAAEATAVPAAQQQATTVPAATGVSGSASAPTAQPAATATPVSAAPVSTVHPGKLTWLVGSFHNERFDYVFSGGHDYARQVHGFLISSDVDETGTRRVEAPGIASAWEISDDGLAWTFTIRQGLTFHDGSDLTTEDVLWTLQHIMGPQAVEYGGGGVVNLAKKTDRIEQTGDDQVTLFNNVITTEIPERVGESGGGWYGAILPKRATLHDDADEEAYDRNPIGAGPFALVEHVAGDSMLFERFDDFYQQPAHGYSVDKRATFAELDLRVVPEEATRVAALRAGEADIAPVSLSSKNQIESGGGRLIFGQEGSYFDIRQIGCWSTPAPPCADKRVRQALNYAIDKEIIQNQLYGGPEVMQIKGLVNVTPSTIGYGPELDPFPYDPDKARQLLADAGYPGGEGFGKLIINTYISPALPLMPESALLGADMWKKELGIDVEVNVTDQGALSAAMQGGEHPGEIWWRDNETRLDAAGNVAVFWGANDRAIRMTDDPEVLALVANAVSEFDQEERVRRLNNAYRRLLEESHAVGLGYLNIPWAVGSRVKEWSPFPLATYPSGLHTVVLE